MSFHMHKRSDLRVVHKSDKHICNLEDEHDIVKEVIDTGLFIQFRRHLYRYVLINENHPLTPLYFKSGTEIKLEEARHTVVYKHKIHPFSMFSLHWEFVMFFVYTVFYFVIPFILFQYHDMRWYQWFFLAIDIFQLIDIIINFCKGYYCSNQCKVNFKTRSIAIKYLKSFFFIDVLPLIPIVSYLFRKFLPIPPQTVLKYSSLPRLLRCCTWTRTLDRYHLYKNTSDTPTRFVCLMMEVGLFMVTGSIFYSTYMHALMYNRGELVTLEEDNKRAHGMALNSLFLLLGIAKHTDTDGMMILLLMFPIGMHIYILAKLYGIFSMHLDLRRRFVNMADQINQYASFSGLSVTLKRHILRYFEFRFPDQYFKEHELLETLSPMLKQEIMYFSHKHLLESTSLSHFLPRDLMMTVSGCLKTQFIMPNDVLVKRGDLGHKWYGVVAGRLSVMDENGVVARVLEDGDVLGEIAVVMKQKWEHTVVADCPTELVVLKHNVLMKVLNNFPDYIVALRENAIEQVRDQERIQD